MWLQALTTFSNYYLWSRTWHEQQSLVHKSCLWLTLTAAVSPTLCGLSGSVQLVLHGVNWISITSEAPCVKRRTVKQAVLTNTEKQSSWPQLICAICDSCRSETVGAREDSLWPLWVKKKNPSVYLSFFFLIVLQSVSLFLPMLWSSSYTTLILCSDGDKPQIQARLKPWHHRPASAGSSTHYVSRLRCGFYGLFSRHSEHETNSIKEQLQPQIYSNCHWISALFAESLGRLGGFFRKAACPHYMGRLFRKFWVDRERPTRIELLCHYWPLNRGDFGFTPHSCI